MDYTNVSEGFLDKKIFVTNKNLFFSNDPNTSQIENIRIERVTIQKFFKKNLLGLSINPEIMIKQSATPTTQIKY
jgi:hypothetical protein